MSRPKSEFSIRVSHAEERKPKIIEWNVNMEVQVSNVKRLKIFQITRNLVPFVLAVICAILLSHLKREVRALQVQVHCVNTNFLLSMLRYEKLNRHLNRVLFHRPRKNLREIVKPTDFLDLAEDSSETIAGNIVETSTSFYDVDFRNFPNTAESNDEVSSDVNVMKRQDMSYGANSAHVLTKLKEKNSRRKRALMTFEKRNSSAANTPLKDRDDFRDDLIAWRDTRAGRSRRDEGRGPLVATFVGAIPEQRVIDTVYVGPWVKSSRNDTQYTFTKFHLVEDKKSIEVTTTGLYMISAQIYYFGDSTNYSYWILLSSEGASSMQKLTKCATAAAASATEVSCHTSVVLPLRRGDRLHIQQQENDRLINLREGYSYLQLVLLSGTKKRAS